MDELAAYCAEWQHARHALDFDTDGVVIKVDHLTKRYGLRTVVCDLSFVAEPGRVTGFLGPNGSGKSTILKTIAALFDVDGTLFTGQVWRGMLDYFRVHRGKRAVQAFWYAHLPGYALRKARLISEERFRGAWGADLAWLVRGWDEAQLQRLYDFIAHEYVKPLRREDTIRLLADHNRAGHVTVLVSTGFTGMIAKIASTLGAQVAVGCDLAMRDGRRQAASCRQW